MMSILYIYLFIKKHKKINISLLCIIFIYLFIIIYDLKVTLYFILDHTGPTQILDSYKIDNKKRIVVEYIDEGGGGPFIVYYEEKILYGLICKAPIIENQGVKNDIKRLKTAKEIYNMIDENNIKLNCYNNLKNTKVDKSNIIIFNSKSIKTN